MPFPDPMVGAAPVLASAAAVGVGVVKTPAPGAG
jgi:hypothetical protein